MSAVAVGVAAVGTTASTYAWFVSNKEILGNKGWTEKFRYFPIDQSEMDRAKGGLTQNPGWL